MLIRQPVYYLLLAFLLSGRLVFPQVNLRDSSIAFGLISPSYALHLPAFDMKDRFGMNSAVGASIGYKTKGNWYYGIEGNFIFSEKLKSEESILANISTSDGHIIDKAGIYANIVLLERGFDLILKAGKINYYAGIEVIEALTRSRRAYYFAEMIRPNEKRFDMLIGLKVGWSFPLYKKVSREYYYY